MKKTIFKNIIIETKKIFNSLFFILKKQKNELILMDEKRKIFERDFQSFLDYSVDEKTQKFLLDLAKNKQQNKKN